MQRTSHGPSTSCYLLVPFSADEWGHACGVIEETVFCSRRRICKIIRPIYFWSWPKFSKWNVPFNAGLGPVLIWAPKLLIQQLTTVFCFHWPLPHLLKTETWLHELREDPMFGRYGYSTRGSPAQESSIRAFRLPGTGTLTIEISKIDMRFVRDGQNIKSRKVYEPDDINSMV